MMTAHNAKRGLRHFLIEPALDYLAAIDAMRNRGAIGLAKAFIALVVTWFIYVPIHELLHAAGCILAGGSVTRLEIAPEYGGTLLAKVFPVVVSGSNYAGQLTGFDTRGSDLVYLATVLMPFVLTVAIGVPLLKFAGHSGGAERRANPWLIGASVIVAYAPFVSLIGDYYEAGSIIVSRLAQWAGIGAPIDRWRSDDLPLLISRLHAAGSGADVSAIDWVGVGTSALLAIVLALLTYRMGAIFARAACAVARPSQSQSPS